MNQATLLDFDKYFLIYKYIAHVCMYVCMKHAFRLLVKTNLGANLETTSWLHRASNNVEIFYYQQYTFTQCTTHTPCRSQYAAIALTTPCTSFMQILLTKCVIFSQALTVAP